MTLPEVSPRVGVCVLASLLLLMACGGSSGSTSNSSTKTSPTPTPTKAKQAASIDACILVAASDASAATGVTLTSLPSGAGGAQAQSLCIYADQTGATQTSVFVIAQVYPDTSQADAVQPDQIAAIMRGQFGVSNSKAVTGIGDKAFEYTATSSAGGGVAIFVFKANVVMMIVMSPTTDPSKVEALARIAVNNLAKAQS